MPPPSAAARLPRLAAAAGALLPLLLADEAGGGGAAARLQDPAAPPGRTPCSRHAQDRSFAGMCAWLEDACNATGTGRLFMADFEHGGVPVRGLGVSSDVASGEFVACVPKACWLNEDVLPRAAGAEDCPEYERLALWLAAEKARGLGSFFHPYFPMLPTEEVYRRFHPAYLEGFELDESMNYWKVWLGTLSECHGGRESPSWEEAKLAYVQLLTRQYETAGMIPLLDLPNTGPQHELNVAQSLNTEGDFCLQALRNLPAGTELLVDYGAASHSPTLMFLTYGFALGREHHNETVPSDEEYESSEYMLSPRDGCAGLRRPGFRPPADAGPALQHLARFAASYCEAGDPEPREEL